MLFFGTLHSDAHIFPFLLCFSLLFTAICKASPDSHFAFLHFFSMGMVLIPVSCTVSLTSIHSSSGTLSIRSSLEWVAVPFSSGPHSVPYDYKVEVRNRFKGLDLIECLMNYGRRFVTLYRRQGSRPSPRKRNAKKQNGCLRKPYK